MADVDDVRVEAVLIALRATCDEIRTSALAALDAVAEDCVAELDAAAVAAQAEISSILNGGDA